jgi:drug/metabolite transporter (DMT)-like permease
MSAGTRAAALGACVLWAVSFVAIKIVLEELPPWTLVSLRLMVASVCFVPLILTGGRLRRISDAPTVLRLAGLSLFGAGLHYGFQTVGLQYTSAANAAIYVATGPISILLLAVIFLSERLNARKIFGITIAVIGVLVVMGLDTILGFRLPQRVVGDLLVIASLFLWACFTVFGKRLTDSHGALTVTAAVTVIGTVWMLPVGWWDMASAGVAPADISLEVWLAVIFLGAGCTFGAVLLYFVALERTESQKVGVYLYTIPPMTAVMAALVLGERITLNLVIGTLLVIGGVALTERG